MNQSLHSRVKDVGVALRIALVVFILVLAAGEFFYIRHCQLLSRDNWLPYQVTNVEASAGEPGWWSPWGVAGAVQQYYQQWPQDTAEWDQQRRVAGIEIPLAAFLAGGIVGFVVLPLRAKEIAE